MLFCVRKLAKKTNKIACFSSPGFSQLKGASQPVDYERVMCAPIGGFLAMTKTIYQDG